MNIIKNYDNLSTYDKYIECENELNKIENKILDFENFIMDDWYNDYENLYEFRSQQCYLNYMFSTPKYINMTNTKNILENELYLLGNKLE